MLSLLPRLFPSSRGLGHQVFILVTGVRIPVGTPLLALIITEQVVFFCFDSGSPSSRGPGHQVLILVTRVRIPLGMPFAKMANEAVFGFSSRGNAALYSEISV